MLGDKTHIFRMKLCSLTSNGVVEVNVSNILTSTTRLGDNEIKLMDKGGTTFSFVLPWSNEPDLYNRMIKAFKRLIELGSKK